jgi:chromosome segregation ATPase
LQEQIKVLQAEVDETRKALEALRTERANDSTVSADQQTLFKTRADLEAIKAETAAQVEALHAATAKISALELEASGAESLATEIASLRSEKEETSQKLSELEVEILERKDAQELAEEEYGKSKAQIDSLRDEVAAATAATEKAVQEAAAKESAAAEHLEKVKTEHEEALALAQEESKRLTEQLHALQREVDELRSNLETANAAAASAADEHERRLQEAERAQKARQDELTAEVERVSAELAVSGTIG